MLATASNPHARLKNSSIGCPDSTPVEIEELLGGRCLTGATDSTYYERVGPIAIGALAMHA
jgi:hypothetical protein